MGDDIGTSIKRTQDQLGKFVKKPPLTDKNLSRPPFRFLHDIVHNVIDTTGFMEGVFTPEEMDAANITSREAKTAFMQKLITAIKDKSGEDVPVKISKILAGLEAEKTNALLQALAKSVEAHQQEGGAGASGPPPPAAKKPSKKPGAAASKSKTGPSKPDTKKGPAKSTDKKDSGSGGTKRTIRDPSPTTGGGSGGTTGRGAKQGKSSSGDARSKSKALKATGPPETEPSIPASIVNDETTDDIVGPPQSRASTAIETGKKTLTRKESSTNLEPSGPPSEEANVDLDNKEIVGRATSTSTPRSDPINDETNVLALSNNNLDISDTFPGSPPGISPVNPNMQTLPPPKTPILTDADAVIATMTPPPLVGEHSLTPTHKPSLTPTLGQSLTPSPSPLGIAARGRPSSGAGGPRSLSREASAEQGKGSPFGSASIGEVRPPTGQQVRSRPDTGTRLSSARPPSARRAPPRPKSSVVREEAEPYRPTTGKVAHVILDNIEDPDDDDDNYVVREVTIAAASKPPGLSDLDETPELGILGGSGALGATGELDSILPPDQRGLLVNQILETQKELEDKGKDVPIIEKKLKELSIAEIDKLKNLIQLCARSANPLAKLLDYMAEDVDSMQKEYNNYREESKKLSLELENAKNDTDKFLQNLKHELADIERKIKDKEDAILTSQIKIIQQEERIEEIVVGFERVRSGKSVQAAREHMPSSEEILQHIQAGGGLVTSSYGPGGGSSSAFTFSSVGPNIGSTPSSAASVITNEPFKIPDSFMVPPPSGGGGDAPSPFSRGRMWANSPGNATFDVRNSIEEDDDQLGSMGGAPRRSTGRSGGNLGGSFRRSATQMDYDNSGTGSNAMDVDNFNPWG